MKKDITFFADDMSANKELWLKWELKPYKQKAWITFLDDNFEEEWQPLTLEVYGKEKHLDWHPRISMDIARSKYPDRKWGISYCEQKDMNNACRDNF